MGADKGIIDLDWYSVIMSSMKGDAEAIAAVLKHYEGYIARLSLCRLRDGEGLSYEHVDEDIRRRLEIRLALELPKFRIFPE